MCYEETYLPFLFEFYEKNLGRQFEVTKIGFTVLRIDEKFASKKKNNNKNVKKEYRLLANNNDLSVTITNHFERFWIIHI